MNAIYAVNKDYRLPKRQKGLFAWSNWDGISVLAAFAHLAFIIWVVADFAHRPWWGNLICCALYSIGISWNINGVSHNFLHTPFFRSKKLNYAFSLLESITIGFSQTYYTWVHFRHHEGNSDRIGPNGGTRDWLSIYRHGKNGEPENAWRYVFLSFFRDGGSIHAALKKRRPFDALWGRIEIAAFICFVAFLAWLDWRAVLALAPFYYFGECLSSLNGYYEHFGSNPEKPIAWGVSTYAPIYNFLWFNNGHHAEHHFRPAIHWTRLPRMRRAIANDQRLAGIHIIETAHAFGFLSKANRPARSEKQWSASR